MLRRRITSISKSCLDLGLITHYKQFDGGLFMWLTYMIRGTEGLQYIETTKAHSSNWNSISCTISDEKSAK